MCLFAQAGSVGAQSPGISPARFSDDSQLERIGLSPRDLGRAKDSISIRCQSFVEADGKLTYSYCVPPNVYEDQRVTRKIVRAMEDMSLTPAEIDGSVVRVLMSFTVSVVCSEDDCSVSSVPHHGFSREDLGDDYVAPQPVLAGIDWYTGFADKIEWIDAWMPNISRTLNQSLWPLRPRFAVTVAADGSASDGCIHFLRGAGDDREQQNRRKLEEAMSSIGNPRFIPGFHEGRPVTMRFYESAVLYNVAQTVSARRLFDQGGRISNRFYPRQIADRTEAPDLYCVG